MTFRTKAGKIRWGIKLNKTMESPECGVTKNAFLTAVLPVSHSSLDVLSHMQSFN